MRKEFATRSAADPNDLLGGAHPGAMQLNIIVLRGPGAGETGPSTP